MSKYLILPIRKFIVIGLIIFPFITNYVWVIAKFCNNDIMVPSWGFTGFYTLYSIAFYELGRMMKTKLCAISCISLILMGLILNVFEVYVYSNVNGCLLDNVNSLFPTLCSLLITIGIWQLCQRIPNDSYNMMVRCIKFIAQNALGIYIFHIPLIVAFRHIYNGTISGFVGVAIVAIIVLLAATFNHLISKTKIGYFFTKL